MGLGPFKYIFDNYLSGTGAIILATVAPFTNMD